MTKHHKNVRDEAVRAVIFVFLLLAVSELLAPYFHISFSDPLMLAGFVTGIMGYIIKPKQKPHLLIVKESDLPEIVNKLSGVHAAVSGITVAESADHAVTLLTNPAKNDGVLVKISEAVKLK